MEAIEKLRSLPVFGQVVKLPDGNKTTTTEPMTCATRRTVMQIADEIEAEIEQKYMRLPVDADGVPIHVGDVMCSAGIREKGHEVIVSAIFEDGFVEYGSDNGLIGPLCQEDWVHADPYKELLVEFAYRLCDMSVADGDLRRYADKFRELGKAGA